MLDDLLFLTYDIQAKNLGIFLFRNTAHSRELFLLCVSSFFLREVACVLYIQGSPPKMFLEQLYNLGLLHNKTSSKGEPENIIL
jgi:hypothetical protein